MSTLAAKIAQASSDLGNRLKADKKNMQGGGYAYISADKLIAEAGAVLAANGVAVFPSIVGYNVDSGESSGGKRNYIVTVNFMMVVSDGESNMDCPWMGAGVDYGAMDKALYKGITSGHKYFLAKLLNIGEGNEDGEHENPPAETQTRNGGAQQQTRPTAAATNGTTTGNGTVNGAAAKGAANGNSALWQKWQSAVDAKTWAEESGACDNAFEANNSWIKLVNERFDGKVNRQNMADVFAAYYEHQMDKLSKRNGSITVNGAQEMAH
jgi:hypothetical protein